VTAKFWVCAAACASFALAQLPGTFAPTGAMAFSRVQHTAALLSTGKVLITGGIQGNTVLSSAELYDPSSGTFSATGSMITPRGGHTAILLADGRVLIAGGFPNTGGFPAASGLASAELYDPATGVFTRTGDMSQGRAYHAATLLANGKVLIAGNEQESAHTAELYDPVAGTFSAAGVLPFIASRLTLLTSGKVLVQGYGGDGNARAGLYDPDTAAFTPTGLPVVSYAPLETTMLMNGKVLNAAFDDCGWWTDTAELYDPSNGAFTAERLTAERRGASATLLSDGTVLIAGGGAFGNHAEIYHPKVVIPPPFLFSLSGDGKGPGAILHASTQRLVSPDNPAIAREALEIFGTGLIDGNVIPPQVAIGGRMAEVLYFGKAPGYTGLNQINVRVPNGVVAGSSVSVRLNYMGRPSNEVTIGVQ